MAGKIDSGKLEPYRDKRSADRTPEPFGGRVRPSGPSKVGRPALFVVQQHDATRMHWDLRLEIDGVLRSWAVPRGVSVDPNDKRMAVLTEDHPIEYVDFEGIIPEGNYGAGAMIVWDRGTYVPHIDMNEGFEAGKLLFELSGYKLRGVWTLVRTKGEDGKQWLLIKKPDGGSTVHGATEPTHQSILSGLTVHDLHRGAERAAELTARAATVGIADQDVSLDDLECMLAEATRTPHSRTGWIYELKYDGFRVIASRDGSGVRLRYRSGHDATHVFPEVVRTLMALPHERFVLDGEACVLDPDGRPNFQRLQKRTLRSRTPDLSAAMREHPVTYYAFDLLAFGGHDLRRAPLVERKKLLAEMAPAAGPVRYTDHVEVAGEALFEQVRAIGLEGIVAKRADSRYVAGRTDLWQKIRIDRTDDFVIVGFTSPKEGRTGFGALHLGTHVDGVLTYAGRVGTGFSEAQLTELHARLLEELRDSPPCQGAMVPSGSRHHWVAPRLVCEVRFRQVTEVGQLRHPVFLRMREDKEPQDCELRPDTERDVGPAEDEHLVVDEARTDDEQRVVVTNPDKVFWPEEGYTKLDLIQFYRSIAPWLLPYLEDRPVVLTRYPDGIQGKSFFQKNAPPYVPDWLRTETVYSEHGGREIDYFVCRDADGIAYLANMGAIPLHVWSSRVGTLQQPDWCILDLDPKGAPFSDVITIALAIKELCDEIGLPSFIKTSGSTGLHILVPVGRRCTHEQSRMLGQILARVIVDRLPEIATIERVVERRQGRVYVDFIQNGHGRLLVAPYSVRPRKGATVSTPLRWDEVGPDLDHEAFTIVTVPQRVKTLEDPVRPILDTPVELTRVLERLASLL